MVCSLARLPCRLHQPTTAQFGEPLAHVLETRASEGIDGRVHADSRVCISAGQLAQLDTRLTIYGKSHGLLCG